MNILSYNIRGLGRGAKWSAVTKLVKKHHADLLCLQETKKESIDRTTCQALWGDFNFSWVSQPASNIAGGLLCIWNDQTFRVERRETGRGFIFLEGVWVQNMQRLFLVNVYAPCDGPSRRTLWEDIKQLKSHNPDGNWCIMGDFNSIRDPSERVSAILTEADSNSISEFNNWLADLEVDEAQCVGRRFTWYRLNRTVKSKLDRFFVSHEWISLWPGSTYFILDRNFSDHCPILFKASNVDWGPKPFRVLDCWLKEKSFEDLVKGTWRNTVVRGWGGYSLKEKIKRLKVRMKQLNTQQFGDTANRVQQLESALNTLETSSNDRQLTSSELEARKKMQEDLWTAAQAHESLLQQKARSKWLREGDCNSRYFHLIMNSNRRSTAVKGVSIDGIWVDDPIRVKEEVRRLFLARFSEPDPIRPELSGIKLRGISLQQNDLLVRVFQEDKIKAVVWECGNDKSPGLD